MEVEKASVPVDWASSFITLLESRVEAMTVIVLTCCSEANS